jgi:hypothetical protein
MRELDNVLVIARSESDDAIHYLLTFWIASLALAMTKQGRNI